jgi:hypothetical protein
MKRRVMTMRTVREMGSKNSRTEVTDQNTSQYLLFYYSWVQSTGMFN